MDNNFVLLRGAPGAGKTTFAKTHFPLHVLLEADQYFMVGDRYIYDKTRIRDAHQWCQWRWQQCVDNNIPCVVANTFTRLWEVEPYLINQPKAKVYHIIGSFINTHGVPSDKVDKMLRLYERKKGEEIVHLL